MPGKGPAVATYYDHSADHVIAYINFGDEIGCSHRAMATFINRDGLATKECKGRVLYFSETDAINNEQLNSVSVLAQDRYPLFGS